MLLPQYSVAHSPQHAMAGGMLGSDSSSYDSDTSTMSHLSHLSVIVSPHASSSPAAAYCNPFYWQRVVSPETLEALPYYPNAGLHPVGSAMPLGSPHCGCAPLLAPCDVCPALWAFRSVGLMQATKSVQEPFHYNLKLRL